MAATRYHRIRPTSITHYNNWTWMLSFSAWEIKFYTGIDQTGTEFASLGTASGSGLGGYEASKANDGNANTRWTVPSNDANMQTWTLDSGAGNAYQIQSLSITAYADGYGVSIPKTFVLEESSNGTDWSLSGAECSTTNTTTDKTVYNFNIIPISKPDYTSIIPSMTIY